MYVGDVEMPGGSGFWAASGVELQSFFPKNCSWPGAAELSSALGLIAGLRPPGAFWAHHQYCGEGAFVNPAPGAGGTSLRAAPSRAQAGQPVSHRAHGLRVAHWFLQGLLMSLCKHHHPCLLEMDISVRVLCP